ncbi:hypothetical protein J2S09_002287 [Bacillus fengqiuensis]|nr:hypothetical protein [Bacillus fengqiuensis]
MASQSVIIVKYHSGYYGEWVTLANITGTDINLTNWKMREYQSTTTVGQTWQFPQNTVIKAKSLLIVKRTHGSGITGGPANIPVVQSTLGPFGRDGEKIVLLNGNQQVDELIFRIGSTLYSGYTPFQIPASLTRSEAFVRKFINDKDSRDDWEIVTSPTVPIKAWEWAPLTSDIEPPAKVSSIPADRATNVAVDTPLTATFSEPIFAGPALQNVTITDGNNNPVELGYAMVSGSELSILHAVIEYNKTYTVNIPAQAFKDAAGNFNTSAITWSFTTVAVDILPPVPLPQHQYPTNGATDVYVAVSVGQHFNEPLLPGPALESVTIKDENNIPLGYVQARISDLNPRALSIDHSTFEYNKTYTVNIPAQAVMDAAGNANASAVTWSFTTAAPPPQTAAPVANLLTFHNNVPEYAQVYGNYGAVEVNPWGTTVRVYSSAAKDTLLGVVTTITGSFWLTFNNTSSLQTVYVTATAEDGKTESPVTPLPVSVSDTDLVAVSIVPVFGGEIDYLDAPIKVTFNKPVLAGPGIQAISIYEEIWARFLDAEVSVNDNELLIQHPTFMNSGYPFYDVFVPANAVTDTAGNPLATPLIYLFVTEWIIW